MMDKGINVTLGTDGTASNNNLNMFEEMHLAEIMHDGYHNDPTLISTQEVLDMATVNGAKLQGRDDTGVLAVGKKADIIAIDLSKAPPLSQFRHARAPDLLGAGGRRVHDDGGRQYFI